MKKSINIAIIPAYKPGMEMPETVRELKEAGFEVVVVNDGSGSEFDHVFDIARELTTVVEHDVNKGKGEALKTGIRYIRESYPEPYIIVTADADGQHKTKDIINVCSEAEAHPDSLILGSRKFDKDVVPLRSRMGNTITRMVYRISSGVKVFDTQTGLRAFSHRLSEQMLEISGSRYEYEMNVLMEMSGRSVPIREVWIETVYLNDNSSSHFSTIKDSFRIYKEILKYSASSFMCFLADYGLFCVLSLLTGSAVYSNIIARICSSLLNFGVNRKFVFCSENRFSSSALKYFCLAAVVLLLNTLILRALAGIGISAYVS
ncbi:MAG: bifunctional glycosyltransferase family 2/GtrA family protein, partial [Oscillospiraceae bacterium]|nr:bifunctional glycosyltransferase family 2/GtrA family protein [Oscillospiraceae bacterium]